MLFEMEFTLAKGQTPRRIFSDLLFYHTLQRIFSDLLFYHTLQQLKGRVKTFFLKELI